MLNTFEALAKFSDGEKKNETAENTEQNDTNATVDISAIINRLNEMETKINELANKSTEFPTRGNNDSGENDSKPAPNESAENSESE